MKRISQVGLYPGMRNQAFLVSLLFTAACVADEVSEVEILDDDVAEESEVALDSEAAIDGDPDAATEVLAACGTPPTADVSVAYPTTKSVTSPSGLIVGYTVEFTKAVQPYVVNPSAFYSSTGVSQTTCNQSRISTAIWSYAPLIGCWSLRHSEVAQGVWNASNSSCTARVDPGISVSNASKVRISSRAYRRWIGPYGVILEAPLLSTARLSP